MAPAGTAPLKASALGDLEIEMIREFDAPRPLVFDAFTTPELVKQWLLGPPGWSMPVCEIDLKVGGVWRYVWQGDESTIRPSSSDCAPSFGSTGVYREISVPSKIVNTEHMDGFDGESVVTTVFQEAAGRTTVTMTMRFESKEARDGALRTGMESGVAASYARLDGILASAG